MFLDRDGTLAVDVPYCSRVEDFHLYADALEALAALSATDFLVVVATNQSGIARGFLDAARLHELHRYMEAQVARGSGRIDAVYYCPHHPEDGCECRKPRPGLLVRASADLDIDLRRSFFIGDQEADVQAAHAVGSRAVLLDRESPASRGSEADARAPDLVQAVRWILSRGADALPQ